MKWTSSLHLTIPGPLHAVYDSMEARTTCCASCAILAEGRMTGFVAVRDAHYDPIRAMVRRAEIAGFLTIR